MYISNYRRRTEAVFFCFLVFLALSIARLSYIQFFRSNYLAGIASHQHNLYVELEPRRGSIVDANLKAQAFNVAADSVYAVPADIQDKETLIRRLSPLLGLSERYLRERLSRKKYFVWLARKITPEQSVALKKLNAKGIGFMKESRRSYPNAYLTSHTMGFAGLDNVGLEGLERQYNDYLGGEAGWALYLRDARQKRLDLLNGMVSPKDGHNVVLTIDEVVQYIAERELDAAFTKYRARGAGIIVMDPHTGAILAMATRPTFDLNSSSQASPDTRRNRIIADLFEPGSVFKIVTAAAALEEKKVSEEDKFFCENGSYRFFSHTLHDHRPHGWLTFREVIEQSSNIGTSKVAQQLGPETLYRYIKLFGFGSKLGIDLPGEIGGMVREPRSWSKISLAAIPMGQEVGVTTLQLASAISVIANGGQLMRPYLVREVRDKHNQKITTFLPAVIHRAVSPDTAARVRKILTGVVENGTGKLSKPPSFSAAGKTGTAQKLEPNGTYSHNKFVGSFIGFAPAEDPLIAVAVVLDEPRPVYFGGVVAAPVFKNVAEDVVKYLKARETERELTGLYEAKRTR